MRYHNFVLVGVLVVAGCGGPHLASVSGRVTLDGKPAAGVHVSFQPVASGGNKNPGGGSYAITDPDGRYSLKTVDTDATGAIVGPHRVEITTRITDDSATDSRPKGPRTVIPAKFNKDSTLTFTVPSGGATDANFDLTSK